MLAERTSKCTTFRIEYTELEDGLGYERVSLVLRASKSREEISRRNENGE